MDARLVRRFAGRDWASVEASKRDYWARRYRDRGPEATFAAAQALYEHARTVRPDWPTARERDEDLAHHIEVERLFERAAGAFARRGASRRPRRR